MRYEVDVPDGKSGDYEIETFEISKDEAILYNVRNMRRPMMFVAPGKYKRLRRANTIVMSNTPMEARTNAEFIHAATGRVLINGLGLGMVLTAILKKQAVTEVWVIERSADVINLVGPTFDRDPRVRIICADALEYTPPQGVKFDAVWHDIWDDISSNNLPQMHKLHRRYGRIAKWQGSWARSMCERVKNGRL